MTPGLTMAPLINRRRLSRLGSVAGMQLAVQGLSFLCGIVIVRLLDPGQYGLYTLALSLVGMALVLGDLGLSSAVMAQTGRLLDDGAQRGQLLAQARRLQRPLVMASFAVLAPAALGLLVHQGHEVGLSLLMLSVVAGTAALQLHAQLGTAVGRVLGQVAFLQQLELLSHAGRLALLLLVALAGLTQWLTVGALAACLVSLVVGAVYAWALAGRTPSWAPRPVAPGTEHDAALRRLVRAQAPNSVYFVFSSQAAVWLVALFGDAERVAEVGALGRHSALFVVITAVSATLVLPFFSRHERVAVLRAGLWAVNVFFALLFVALLMLAAAAPQSLLWVLGSHYAGLQRELPWMLAAGTLAAWGGTLYSIGSARGWVLPFSIAAPAGVLATVLAAQAVDLSTVRGGFMLNTAISGTALLAAWGYLQWRLHTHARKENYQP